MPNYLKYQRSISEELLSVKDRVRDIIDGRHWGEDGRYKEIILREIIAERLPSFAALGTGFVAGPFGEMSNQIDIIVYRADFPVLFKKADFVVVPAAAVIGIIEVKTKLEPDNVQEAFEKAQYNGSLVPTAFNGIFSYESGFSLANRLSGKLEKVIKAYPGFIDHVSLGANYFIKYWEDGHPFGSPGKKYQVYKITGLSFGYFISNLIEQAYITVRQAPLPNELSDILYPIENTKEASKIYTIPV